MNYDRMRELAGVPAVVTEGRVNDALSRYGIEDYQTPAKLYGLYVGLRGSGELHIQFTGDRADCLSQWHDDLKRDYKRGEAVARVVPIHDNAPNVIAESFECDGAEDIVVEAEEVKVEDKAPELDAKAEKKAAKVKVPADVSAAITARIAELKQSIAQYNEKGYDDGGVKLNAIEALEQIAADLKLEDGLTVANVFYGTLMSPITDLLPPKVVKFLHSK